MAKQYTFRTTRETKWLDDILMEVPTKDRARFIRKLIISGLWATSNELQLEDKPKSNELLTEVKPKSNIAPLDISPPPPTEEGIEDTEIDLDSKLNSLDF
ncbi:hypothetical protein [Bacillus sp. FJAT-22090]|uniref:hypothetical protein n=1 Tax=Bacillus sp. FJAT-22090 TaxID=1581038 RepID=UPI0011A5B996|nr:hypothetical protein [Bacillus sp. FJAT-22090]